MSNPGTPETYVLRPLDRNDDGTTAALHALSVVLESERSPDDPPPVYEQTVASLRVIPSFVRVHLFGAFDDSEALVGMGLIGLVDLNDNRHMAQFDLRVHPEHRRRGLGRRLLQEIAGIAASDARTLLMTSSSDSVPSGAAFLNQAGARVGLASHTQQLKMSALDSDLLENWTRSAPEATEPGWWIGAYPDENLAEIVALNDLMNQVPRGDLEVDDMHVSGDEIRQVEASMLARGVERWTHFLRDTTTNRIAGYTEVMWNPHKPAYLSQGITAVWPEFRGRGIGRFLKAAVLKRVRDERPGVEFVRTDNADSNVPMKKINADLGFVPYRADFVWQAETERLREFSRA